MMEDAETPPDASAPNVAALSALEVSAAAATRLLKLLASEHRLLLLYRMIEGEASVGDLAGYAGIAQSAASQHLAKLRAEDVVVTRRDGQTIYYGIADPGVIRMITALCDIYKPKGGYKPEGG
jgi:DNA-binding transcriptional ArsR family regulator